MLFNPVVPSDPLQALSTEILCKIYTYLDPKSARRFSQVNQQFRGCFLDERVQKDLLLRHFHLPSFNKLPSELYLRQSVTRLGRAQAICTKTIGELSHDATWCNCLPVNFDQAGALVVSFNLHRLEVRDLATGTRLHTLSGHSDRIECVLMSPRGTRALSCSLDGTLKFWDLIAGTCLQTLSGHSGEITCVDMSDDETGVLSGSRNGTLQFWDLTAGTCLQILSAHSSPIKDVRMSPDRTRAFSLSFDGTLKFWDLTEEPYLKILSEPSDQVGCVRMSDDGRMVLFSSRDGTLECWDFIKGIRLQKLSGHSDAIMDLRMSTDRTRALSTSQDGTSKLWDLTNATCLQTLHWSPIRTSRRFPIQALRINENATTAIYSYCDGTLEFWDLINGIRLQRLSGHSDQFEERPVHHLQMSPGGINALSSSCDGTLKFWNLTSLPQERVHAVASSFFHNHLPAAEDGFALLPSSVKNDVYKYLYEQHRALGKNTTDPQYGEHAFKGEAGYSATNEEKAKSLCRYSAETFLYDVIELFEKAIAVTTGEKRDLANATMFAQAANARFDDFPALIKNRVYEALYEIHRASGKLPVDTPDSYGELAFHHLNGYSATGQERIEAIGRIIDEESSLGK